MERNVKDKKVLLIGAGGAARGIAFALQTMRDMDPIYYYKPNVEKAEQLCSGFAGFDCAVA